MAGIGLKNRLIAYSQTITDFHYISIILNTPICDFSNVLMNFGIDN